MRGSARGGLQGREVVEADPCAAVETGKGWAFCNGLRIGEPDESGVARGEAFACPVGVIADDVVVVERAEFVDGVWVEVVVVLDMLDGCAAGVRAGDVFEEDGLTRVDHGVRWDAGAGEP